MTYTGHVRQLTWMLALTTAVPGTALGQERGRVCEAAASAPDSSRNAAMVKEVCAVNREMERAVARRDLMAVAAIYSDSGRLIGPGGRTEAAGRAAIDRYWRNLGNARSWRLDVLEVGGHRNSPYQIGRSTLVIDSPSGPQTHVTQFVVLWRRENGRLRILIDSYW